MRTAGSWLDDLEDSLEACASWSRTKPSFDYVSSIGESLDVTEKYLLSSERVSPNILRTTWLHYVDVQMIDDDKDCIFERTDCRLVYEIFWERYWVEVGENGAVLNALLAQQGIRAYGIDVPEDSAVHWDESDETLIPVARALVAGINQRVGQ